MLWIGNKLFTTVSRNKLNKTKKYKPKYYIVIKLYASSIGKFYTMIHDSNWTKTQ